MRTHIAFLVVAALLAVFAITTQPSAQADTFGTSGNEFTIDFVNIDNAGNAADTTGYGAVPYEYRMGIYEISQNDIERATASGMANVAAGAWSGNQPAANMNWYEMAAFVNWLNTSTGKQAAYDLTWNGSGYSMALWGTEQAWTLGGTNLYRHKDAHYFLPCENEWYKAAYLDPADSGYNTYPTGSDTPPLVTSGGTLAGTAVYGGSGNGIFSPASVSQAGGFSSYGTMGQGGNIWEQLESALDGTNSDPLERRVVLGGDWGTPDASYLESLYSGNRSGDVDASGVTLGFRVASVPEPSTYALLLMTGAGALWWARRRR